MIRRFIRLAAVLTLTCLTACAGAGAQSGGGFGQLRQAQYSDYGRVASLPADMRREAGRAVFEKVESGVETMETMLIVGASVIAVAGAILLVGVMSDDVDAEKPAPVETPFEHAPNVGTPDFVRVALPGR